MSHELIKYAQYYHNMGMNILPLYGYYSYKEPNSNYRDYYVNHRQSLNDLNQLNWDNATGLGCVLGFNDYRAIDIDGLAIPDWKTNEINKDCVNTHQIADFLNVSLQILGLPYNYPWIMKSGSGLGLHIIIKATDYEDSPVSRRYSYGKKYRTYRFIVEIFYSFTAV